MRRDLATVAQLPEFEEILDVRSPAEFAEDRLPGARNCPALDDAQRSEIGTLYKQVSPFAARRRGAALVARNIADHLLEKFQDRPKEWRPLIYCWRGGQRSGAFVTIFRQIGWEAMQLQGGYKAWRQHVVHSLTTLPGSLDFRVVCGPTGSGKTRFLAALRAEGGQVLDLEELAAHRGSLLGAWPDRPQPAQRNFESQLLAVLSAFDHRQPIFVESESARIGQINVPLELVARIRHAPCVYLNPSMAARIAYLLEDYAWLTHHPDTVIDRLLPLKPLHGGETLARWQHLAETGCWEALVSELITRHYDPLYQRSQSSHFCHAAEAPRLVPELLDFEALRREAKTLLTA